MSVHNREPSVMIHDRVLDLAIAEFTTTLANADATRTSVVEDLLAYQAGGRGVGGRPARTDSIRYSVLAVLVAFYLLITSNRTVSEANACRLLLHELTAGQRERLGMTGDLAGTRYDVIEPGLLPGATDTQIQASARELEHEYARFAKFFTDALRHVDPSPFARNAKMTNADRNTILTDPRHPQRRISPQDSARNQERLTDLAGKILAPSAADAGTDGWHGDIATDETIVIITPVRRGHGTQEDYLTSIDPDAAYWPGKEGDAFPDIGFGYGIGYVVRVPRPYSRQIPVVAIGIHVGRATGGTVAAFEQALIRAERHQLTLDNRERVCVADTKYTIEDAWIPTLIDHGYTVLSDYPSHWGRTKTLADTNLAGDPVNGPILARGPILCPGAAHLTADQWPHPAMAADPEPQAILSLRRIIRRLDALAMPVRSKLARAKSTGPGRPRKNAPAPLELTITVQCPARANKANCINYPRPDGTRLAGAPDVLHPPHPEPEPEQAHLRPRCCTQDYTTYRLNISEAKWVQPHIWGSRYHTEMYGSLRSANERYHSQLKSDHGANVKRNHWIEIRGVAKTTIITAIASPVTNRNITRRFISEGQADQPTNAELARRERERFLTRENKRAS